MKALVFLPLPLGERGGIRVRPNPQVAKGW